MLHPEFVATRIASISLSAIGAILPPGQTMRITPGVEMTGYGTFLSSLQNTSPLNRGVMISFVRSDHFLLLEYEGTNSSYPFPRKTLEATNSCRGRT